MEHTKKSTMQVLEELGVAVDRLAAALPLVDSGYRAVWLEHVHRLQGVSDTLTRCVDSSPRLVEEHLEASQRQEESEAPPESARCKNWPPGTTRHVCLECDPAEIARLNRELSGDPMEMDDRDQKLEKLNRAARKLVQEDEQS